MMIQLGGGAVSKTSTESKRRYNEGAYDRLYITVPKGQKTGIQEIADKYGGVDWMRRNSCSMLATSVRRILPSDAFIFKP